MDVNIVNQEVIIELVPHPRDPRKPATWTAGDVSSGRIRWAPVRNARWGKLVDKRS